MVKINRHIFLGNATENDVGTAIDAVQLLPLIYLGSAEPSPISYIDVLLSGVSPLTLTDALADGLNYLKLFGGTELVPETYLDTVTLGGGTEQRNLPEGYTQVEYLESSGTQYIDTGVVLNSAATIETVAQLNTSSVTGVASFWGFIGPSSGGSVPRWTTGIYGNKWLMNLNTTTQGAYSNADTNKHTFVNSSFYNNSDLYYQSTIDGVNVFQSSQIVVNPESYSTNTLKAYLFARNNGSGVTSYINGKIYQFKITQNDILVINLIPCRRNSDNVLGMYDTVTGNFLTNAGTGSFTAGSDTVPTPDAPMDIVCNNGILKASPNLFNKDLVPDVNEYINRSNGNASAPSSGEFRHSDYIAIKKGTQYYVGVITSVASSAGLAFYDDTKTYLSGISLTQLASDNNIITSPANTKYIRFSFRTDEGYNTNWQNTVYLVEGNQPLAEFMPYGQIYTDGTQEVVTDSNGLTATAEMLLSVNDYKDTQEVLSGSVTRNISIKVLDGTESYVKDGSRYYWTAPKMLNEGNERSSNLLCSHFLASTTGTEGDCFKFSAQIYFYPNMTLYPDATTFKQWLADQYSNGTPVIVVYPTSSATTETVTGQLLSKSPVTQTAGSIDNLPIAITESSHTTPTPQQPLDIVSNNGVLKINTITSGKNAINTSDTEQGYISSTIGQEPTIRPSSASIVIKNAIKVSNGKKYKFSYYSDTAGNRESNIVNNNGIVTSKLALSCRAGLNEYIIEADTDGYLWVTVQLGDFSVIKPTVYEIGQIYTDGTVETVEITGNLVDFNETRINSSTWDSADKTKGFEVYADVYNKSVGDSMLSNANAFGVFVPCKQGESISLNFFDYEPFYSRCLYCEITADRKCNTTPQAYDSANAIIQKTFTLTQSDSIGFVIEWYISGERVRNYTKENYTVIKGTTPPTSYIPYFNGGSATAEMLLKVGDYQDVQSVIDGGVTRNVGIMVLDGTENWSTGSASNPNRYTLAAAFNDLADLIDNNIGYSNCYTVISRSTSIQSNLQNNECGWNTTKVFCVRDDRIATLADWKQFLADQYNAGTPVIIVYPLATPTTESVTGQPLTVQTGTNIVTITQASINDLTMELSYKQKV